MSHGPFVRTEVWNGFTHGDKVICVDPNRRHAHDMVFEFLCHVVNTTNGRQWVECYGGKRGHTYTYCFAPNGIEKAKSR